MQDMRKAAGELLVELEKKGITFETVDGKLKYKDSKGNFTEDSKEKVKKYREEIIEILKKKQTIDDFITDNNCEATVYPLTDVQAAYLVGKTEAVKWGGIGCKGYIEVDFGSYSEEEISRAWEVLVDRHEMLRAKVTETGFEILERDEIDYEIEIINLQKMEEKEKTVTLSRIREDFSKYVFHTENPPLFKVVITKRMEGNFFHLLVDLIVSDFASVQILISEMGELLKGISLEKLRYRFSDYAMFNQQRKGSLKWHQDRMYWIERLKKLPKAPILPQDGRAADKCENTYEFYRFQRHINQSGWKQIKEIAGEYGVTVSAVLIGIYAEVISKWSSNKHFTLNLPIQNRPTMGNNINSIVGDFTAVNLLEVNVTQNMSFIERVKEITERLMEDLEHNSFSGVEVLRELSKVSEEKEVLMPIVFTGVLKTDGTAGTIEYGFSHTPQVWIDCQIVDELDSEDQEKGLMISWDARKGAIKESIVTEMFEVFIETIRILGTKHSEEWKNPLEIVVPSASQKKIICEQNKNVTKQSLIQQRFVEYAQKNSKRTAVIDALEKVTYGELLERAEYIAGYLRKEFVENSTGLVAIRMKKSANQIAAVMGVLIAGFSYLPIDIKQPLARQEKILSKANIILELDEKKVNMILQNLEYRLEKHPESQNTIAYVIFTSGSTGEPKGVVMSHTAAQNTLISIENMYNISEDDTVLGIAELSFDLSVFDIFSVLGVGGTLVLPNPEKGPDASHWGRLLNEYKVTLWNSVPAQAEMLDAFASKSESYPTVRLVLLSGDWINTSLPGRLRRIMTNAQIVSLGGATEGGIWSVFHEIDEIEERPTILYGKALHGQWTGIVDEELRICPQYVSGQIAIGGYSLAEGYLGDSALTEEKFVHVEGGKKRIYLTGDNGRYVENDDIEFLGRLDNQVKINGHRIEIAEIEAALMKIPQVENCCVVYHRNEGTGNLVAFIKERDKLKTILDMVECDEEKMGINAIDQFNECLEKAVCSSVYKQMSSIFNGKAALSKEEIISNIDVQPQYEVLLNRWLELLIVHGYLQDRNGKYELNKTEDNAAKYWEELRTIPYTNIAPDVVSEYIQNHAENICELLGGRINPLIFLFPEGKTTTAEALYGETAIARYLNGIIADVVKRYAVEFKQISILEVGGGIGATTKQILGKMEGLAYEYLFTDVSNFFLNNIRQQYPQVKTELLNLDDWDPSKFGEFHVIIAAGVLNNTKNILETVNKLKHMLRDEGILLVTEPLEEHIEITVSQAFMMPKHSDVRCMTGHCFLTEEEWIQSFDEVGLETVRIFPDEQNKYAQFKQKLFIVRKKQIVYREFLKSILPTVMIPTEFVNVDNIPLSLNGKVDRKALVRNFKRKLSSKDSIIIDQQNSKKQIYTEVEKKMIEIMRIVSGNSNISYEDNLLENGFDSLLLSQASGKIVNEIPEASGLRFDEILRVALVTPMIKMISEYIERKNSESKQKEKVESNDVPVPTSATHNVMYILGSDKGKWKEALEKTMLDSDILVKETEKEKLKTEVKSDAIANKYLLICKDNISEILAEVSELLAQEIIIQKVFLLNPEDAKNNDLYLGDVIVINGAPSVIDSWKEAVLGDMKAYVGSFAETCNIIKKEIDDGK